MNILLIPNNLGLGRGDYNSFYGSEGRIPINIGIGMSKLGHNVFIKTAGYIGNLNNGVRFITDSSPYTFDYTLSFDQRSLNGVNNSRHKFLMVFSRLQEDVVKRVPCCTPFKSMFDYFKQKDLDIKYLPPLYPSPVIHDEFLPFHFKPGKTLKVFSQVGVKREEPYIKLTLPLILKLISSLGYDLECYFQGDHFNTVNFPFKLNKLNNFIPYSELTSVIEACDIGIVFSKGNVSGSQNDILSLGRPLISLFGLGYSKEEVYGTSFLLERKDLLYFHEQSLKDYIFNFFDNIEDIFNNTRETIEDCNYPIWQKHVNKFFNN